MRFFSKKACFLVLAVIFIFTAIFSGCSSSVKPSGSANTTSTYTVGYNNWGQGVFALDLIENEGRYVNETLGNKFMAANDEFKADKLQTDIQNMISSGVNGIMFFGVVPTLIPIVAEQCEKAKVPFVIFDQIPRDETVKANLLKNKYYVGSVGTDNIKIGENMAGYAKDYKTALIIGGAVGDPVHDARVNGFKQAFEANGGKVLGIARCTDPSEAATKGDDLIAANPNAECIYALTGDFATGALTALGNHKAKMKVFASDIEAETLKNIANGVVEKGDGGSTICTSLAAILLQNFMDGHPILTPDGKAPFFDTIVSFPVEAKDAAEYQKLYLDGHPLTEEMIKNLTYRYNKNVSYDTFKEFIQSYSLAKISEQHK